MAMDFLELVGAKTKPGSILNFVNYKKVPVEVVLTEAEAFIYSRLRVREMKADASITLAEHAWTAALPTGYLDPIAMRDRVGARDMIPHHHIEEAGLLRRRVFDEDAYTTLVGSLTVGATAMVVADYSNFPSTVPFSILIDAEAILVTAGAGTANWTITRGFGGTTAAVHANGATVDGALEAGTPMNVAVFNELFQFECKADEIRRFDLVYYKTPAALSASNTTNFLTRRYPHIVRVGCMAGAASYMKDDAEETKQLTKLTGLCEAANAESDLGRPA